MRKILIPKRIDPPNFKLWLPAWYVILTGF